MYLQMIRITLVVNSKFSLVANRKYHTWEYFSKLLIKGVNFEVHVLGPLLLAEWRPTPLLNILSYPGRYLWRCLSNMPRSFEPLLLFPGTIPA